MSLILPGLFLGNKHAARSEELLNVHRVRAILNVGGGAVHLAQSKLAAIDYKKVQVEDSTQASLVPLLDDCCEFIHVQRQRLHALDEDADSTPDGAVLVHCRGGMSRSASVVIAYLLKHCGMTYEQAFEHVKACRPSIRPNAAFVRELRQLALDLQQARNESVT